MPEELAAPYRATLTKLQDAAPPMSASVVHRVLASELGQRWRNRFAGSTTPAAAASIGQVHRAVWQDGREVAVKVQYPGAGAALTADLRQIGRAARLFAGWIPGVDIKPLVAGAAGARRRGARLPSRGGGAAGLRGGIPDDPDIVVQPSWHRPTACWSPSGWSRLLAVAADRGGDQGGARPIRQLYVRFLFSGPRRVGMLHADPHPGNYRILTDGRLGVVDYGAVARLPEGDLPAAIGRLLRTAMTRRLRPGGAGPARRGVHQAVDQHRPGGAARLPRTVRRTRDGRALPVLPGLDAGAVRPGQRPTAAGIHDDAQAEPASVVPADPPGLDRRHRRAQPARDRGAVPGILEDSLPGFAAGQVP